MEDARAIAEIVGRRIAAPLPADAEAVAAR
jgi:hypothetical protein